MNTKTDITIKFRTLGSSIDKDTSLDHEETFHEFLRSATNACTQNVYMTKDNAVCLNIHKEMKISFYFVTICIIEENASRLTE